MRGTVNTQGEAIVRLRLRGPDGTVIDADAVVDSGFTSSLTLPDTVVIELGLARQSVGEANLADGSACQFDIYPAEVEWDGAWRSVLVWALGGAALIGMGLMAGHELRIAVVPGGAVEIIPLS